MVKLLIVLSSAFTYFFVIVGLKCLFLESVESLKAVCGLLGLSEDRLAETLTIHTISVNSAHKVRINTVPTNPNTHPQTDYTVAHGHITKGRVMWNTGRQRLHNTVLHSIMLLHI